MAKKKDENLNKENDNNLQDINLNNSEAGDGKTPPTPNENENGGNNDNNNGDNHKVRIKAKSNTGFKNYYRCGLRFTPEFSDFEVDKNILDTLKKDIHLTIEEETEKE